MGDPRGRVTSMLRKLWNNRILFLILSIVWMILIFCYSARTAEESTEDSYRIGRMIGHVIHRDFEEWPQEEQLAFAESVDHGVRKTAHGLEYAILAFLIGGAVPGSRWSRHYVLLCMLLSVGYACTDEFHQLFVPGRSGQLTDVGIDAIGSAAGMLLRFLIAVLIGGEER